MDILEIDCTSYATRVGYSASAELLNLLLADQPEAKSGLVPLDMQGEDLENMVANMGIYVCEKGCDSGERMFRWLSQWKFYEMPWEEAPEELRLALETFVSVCEKTHTKLRCIQIEEENRQNRPEPSPKPKIEDTIFEPVGSMGELEDYAAEAMEAWSEQPAADDAADDVKDDPGAGDEPGAMSLGETVHSGQVQASQEDGEGGTAPDLPPAPKTPADRKAAAKDKKAAK